ncbi:MOSC domain-containing protein [Acinetobacter tandoii]|nr:MOSC domain-containing protein [Acinetobacter tandoii]
MNVVNIGMTQVKCTRFKSLQVANITLNGILGDREFIILDRHGAPLSSGKHSLFLSLEVDYRAHDETMTIHWPDGKKTSGKCELNNHVQVLDYMGMRNIQVKTVAGNWSQLLSEYSKKQVTIVKVVHAGDGIDVLPLTFYTTASLKYLSQCMNQEVDGRRFRANLVIDADVPHIEDQWNGKLLSIGETIIKVRSSVPRCVVTQLNPVTGKNDLRTIPTLMGYREKVHLPDGLMPDYATPGFASYAEVIQAGKISVGDSVTLLR